LLRDLYKRTPGFYPDKRFLDMVFNVIDFINKQIDQSIAKENRKHEITTVQSILGPNVKVMAGGRQILRETDVRLIKLRSAPEIIYRLNDLVLLVGDQVNVLTQSFLSSGAKTTVASDDEFNSERRFRG
jgi:hypothetical protein